MTPEDREFIEEAARRLDATLSELEALEAKILERVGEARAKELRAFWLNEFEEADMEDIRRSLDFDDRSLLRVWNRLRRNRDRRQLAGRTAMILTAERGDLFDEEQPRPVPPQDVK